jgi:hypothetical protein
MPDVFQVSVTVSSRFTGLGLAVKDRICGSAGVALGREVGCGVVVGAVVGGSPLTRVGLGRDAGCGVKVGVGCGLAVGTTVDCGMLVGVMPVSDGVPCVGDDGTACESSLGVVSTVVHATRTAASIAIVSNSLIPFNSLFSLWFDAFEQAISPLLLLDRACLSRASHS